MKMEQSLLLFNSLPKPSLMKLERGQNFPDDWQGFDRQNSPCTRIAC